MSRIRYEKPALLTPHPLLERVGTMSSLAGHFSARAKKAGKNREEHKERAEELAGDFEALVASIASEGVLEPTKICRSDIGKKLGDPDIWWIVDGRNRWMAAQKAGRHHMPVIRVNPEDAPAIIAATVAGRRHYSKGATAYLACMLHPEFAIQGRDRQKTGKAQPSALSAEGLATKFSVSLRLLEQAAELYRLLEGEGKPFREDVEANIWAGCGLGGVKAGVDFLIANGASKPGKPDPKAMAAAAAWQNFRKASRSVGDLWKSWDAMEAEQRSTAMEGLKDWFAEAPLVARSALLNALKF